MSVCNLFRQQFIRLININKFDIENSFVIADNNQQCLYTQKKEVLYDYRWLQQYTGNLYFSLE